MKQEVQFAKALEELKDTASLQGNFVTKEQIEEVFADFKLDEERFGFICDYLKQCRIGIDEPVNPHDYLSEEEKSYLDNYLEELASLKEMSESERYAAAMSAMAGDKEAQHKLVEAFLPQVVEIAKLYAGQGVFLEDLIGEGNMAAVMGVQMLGCLEDAKEADGMLAKMIMDAMETFIGENVQAHQEEQKLSDKVNKVADAARELAEELQREVTAEELSAESGLSLKVIAEAVDISGGKIEYLQTKEIQE